MAQSERGDWMTYFWQRLKQRKLVQWALAYIATAFALLQGIDIIAQQFGWPQSLQRGLTWILVLGFFIALVLAWYHGERGAQKVSGTELLIVALLLAVGGGLIWRYGSVVGKREADAPLQAEASQVPAAVEKEIPDKSIAVLPFENLSADEENSFFAIGVQDQIITGLARLDGVKVISRTSTERYAQHADSIALVARELGVAHILEGSVQRAGNRVRINVQLIDARSDSHLWAETYDRTLDDIFQVEDDVAGRIAQSLAARLPTGTQGVLVAKPTSNADAYDMYIEARIDFATADNSWRKFQRVMTGYRNALALDPDFVLAMAELATAETQAYWYGYDKDESLLADARVNLERATRLEPNSPQVQAARGVYTYYVEQDFAKALSIMRTALVQLPGDSRLWFFSSLLERRLGQWNASIADNEHALSLSPKDHDVAWSLAATLVAVRQFPRSLAVTDTALAAEPKNPDLLYLRQWAVWHVDGLQAGARVLDAGDASLPQVQAMLGEQALLMRDYAAATSHYRRALAAVVTKHESLLTDMVFGNLPSSIPWSLRLALVEERNGNIAQARKHYTEIEIRIRDELAAKPANLHVEAAWYGAHAMALAGLGRNDEAVAAANRAVALVPSFKDRLDGPSWQDVLAKVYAMGADSSNALALLRQQMETQGSLITATLLQLDPVWDPIRNDPGFQALLKEYAKHKPAVIPVAPGNARSPTRS